MKPGKFIVKSVVLSLLIGGAIIPSWAEGEHHHHHHPHYMKARMDAMEREMEAFKRAIIEQERKPTLKAGNENVSVSLSGWVNRAGAFYDNGYSTELKHVDTNAESTRTTLTGHARLNDCWKAGFALELEFVSDSSNAVDIGNPSNYNLFGASKFSINDRIIEVNVDSNYGRLTAGQGHTANYGLMDIDLSGTKAVSAGLELESIAGGVRFATGHGGVINTGTNTLLNPANRFLRVTDVYNEIFNKSFQFMLNRVRYDTPKFYGFWGAISHSVRSRTDISLNFSRDFGGTKIHAGVGWGYDPFPGLNLFQTPQDNNVAAVGGTPNVTRFLRSVNQIGGSAAVLFPIGISLGFGYGEQKYSEFKGYEGRNRGNVIGFKVGYQHEFFPIGKSCFALSYGQSRNMMVNKPWIGATTPGQRYGGDNSAQATIWGFYAVQHIEKWGSEAYFAWQSHKLEMKNGVTTNATDPATDTSFSVNNAMTATTGDKMPFKMINSFLMGMRIKF